MKWEQNVHVGSHSRKKTWGLGGFMLAISVGIVYGGNPDRVGEAGAYELTMVPWARLAAFNYTYVARVSGLEALRLNPGGLTFTPGTEFAVSHARYYLNGALRVSTLGFAQKIGYDHYLGIEAFILSGGEIPVTTVDLPEGTGATFEPTFVNVALAYGKTFSEFIHVGFVVRTIYEAIKDVYAAGVSFDAGVQYRTEPREGRVLRFGVALRNIGFPIRYRGPGLVIDNRAPHGQFDMSMEIPGAAFELPLLLHLGFSYDIQLKKCYRVTGLFGFTSNAFGDDLLGFGLEAGWKEMVVLRVGYTLEKGRIAPVGIQQELNLRQMNLRSGFSAGFGVNLPLRKPTSEQAEIPVLTFDYAFRPAGLLGNIHTLTVKLGLNRAMPPCVQEIETTTPRM